MIRFRKFFLGIFIFIFFISVVNEKSFAQGFVKKDSDLPDASQFYMSRRRITITDETPIIQHQEGKSGSMSGSGSLSPNVAPLPKAQWMPYSQSVTGPQNSLPRVNNGVPPKAPPAAPKSTRPKTEGLRANAGKIKPAVMPTGSPVAKAYTPYKGYGSPSGSSQVNMGSNDIQSQTAVHGSLLHWARAKRRN